MQEGKDKGGGQKEERKRAAKAEKDKRSVRHEGRLAI